MTTNQIRGGIAVNTIPELCEFTYEFRNLPGMRPDDIQAEVERYVREELLPRMQAEFDGARIEIETARPPRRWKPPNRQPSPSWCAR